MHRRDFIQTSAAAATAAWNGLRVSGLGAAGVFAASVAPDAPYEVLTPAQARLLDAITAQIVPTDETPGAREAHVVRFIDRALNTVFKSRRQDVINVLDAFVAFTAHYRPDDKPFVEFSPAEQIAALQDFQRMRPRLFNLLRGMTMTGMFSHPRYGGNFQKIGWQLIGFKDQYSWAPPFGHYDRG